MCRWSQLTLQLLELKKPVILALNMMDIVEERGMEIDLHRLPEMLGGIPVVPVSARKRTGLDVLMHAVVHHYEEGPQGVVVRYDDALEEKISQIEVILRAKYGEMENMRWHAVKLLEQDPEVMKDHPVDISHIAEKNYEKDREFMSLLKSDLDLFSESVYCFTPGGDVKTLPNGSNTIDFAYSIHSAVGNKMIGARVNGKLVPIDYVIKNGDRIEVITSQNSKGPSRDWLNIVKSTQAKNKINQWFKTEFKEENIVKGKEVIAQYCKMKGIPQAQVVKPEYQESVLRKYGFRDWESVLAAIGHGGLKEGQVVNKMLEEYEKAKKKAVTDAKIMETVSETKEQKIRISKSKSGIVVKGIDDVAVRFSKCCNPVPGDEIVGFVTRGRGVTVHRTDGGNMLHLAESERERLIDAEWQSGLKAPAGEKYTTEIKIYGNNRTGLLVDISRTLTERNIDVTAMNVRTSKQGTATITISFDISSVEELNRIIDKLRQIESVLDIERSAS